MVDKMLLVDDTYGVNAPQAFTQIFDPVKWGIERHDPDWVCVQEGPDNYFYWESWEAICDKASLHDKENNRTWYLHYDNGNIFGIVYHMNSYIDMSDHVYFY